MLIDEVDEPSLSVFTLSRSLIASLQTARQTIGDGRPACMGGKPMHKVRKIKDVFTKENYWLLPIG
jgi:hypothetical protein